MRITLLLILGLVTGQWLSAQNDLTVFAEDGEKFILHINGEQVNTEASARVVKRDISAGTAAVRVVFDGDIAPEVKKNFTFMEKNTHVTAKVTMTKKGYRLRYFGEEPRGQRDEVVEVPSSQVDGHHVTQQVTVDPVSVNGGSSSTTTTKSTTTETTEVPSGEKVQMSIGIDGFSMDVNMSVEDDMIDEEVSMTTTTTTTTTTTSTMNTDTDIYYEDEVVVETTGNCYPPMGNISSLSAAIEGEDFADDRLAVAKQALRHACIDVEAVKELAGLFDFEDDRLEFVKFAYDRTSDIENYYQVNSVFEFSSTKEELNEFLETK